ncbi:MAG: nuclear transport factor 2 family protein [Akkermansiaceae bacterium]|nr:nuclear transport factor 2 family protein [Akkermansiaceae bacterium]
MKTPLIATLFMALSVGALAGHHESGEMKTSVVIGTLYADDRTANELLAGNTDKQNIWVDYIQAHNDRNLEKIAEINAADWEGYVPDGSVIKGNAAHIEWLKDWFSSSDNPKWEIQWMIANDGVDAEGATETWLTTGNDITFNDADGNEVTEHHVHDIQFVGNEIRRINVYSRLSPKE